MKTKAYLLSTVSPLAIMVTQAWAAAVAARKRAEEARLAAMEAQGGIQ